MDNSKSEHENKLIPRAIEHDEDNLHTSYIYDFYAPDLSYAFSALRKWTEKENLSPCTLTMQKYPTLEHKKVKTRKKNADGTPVYADKVVEHKSDMRWVLSFEWKTNHDPKDARRLEYDFYMEGWPASVSFTIAQDEAVFIDETPPDVDSSNNGETKNERKNAPRMFECILAIDDTGRFDGIKDSFEDIVSKFSSAPPSTPENKTKDDTEND